MLGRALKWMVETLTLDFPVIDDQTQPEDVQATRVASRSTEPRHGASPSRSSRKGRPKTSVGDTTGHGSLTTHSHVDIKPGSPAAMMDKATAPQEIYTSGDFNASPRNTSHLTKINGSIVRGTTNILTIEGSKNLQVNFDEPSALRWAEHDLKPKVVKTLRNSNSESGDESLAVDDAKRYVTHRWDHSCTAIPNSEGGFIIFGGAVLHESEPEEIRTNDAILLSTQDMSFTILDTNGVQPTPRVGHRAAIAGRVLVVFGGDSNDRYLHFLNLDTHEWSKLRPQEPYPGPRFGHSFIIVDNQIWLYGGGLETARMDDMWCFDLGNDSIQKVRWRQIPKKDPWPPARSYHSTVYYDGSLYLFAGVIIAPERPEEQLQLNDIWRFEISAETWTKIQCHGQVPQPRADLSATVIGDNMFIYGGLAGRVGALTDDAFVFNFQDHTWRSLAMLGHTPLPSRGGVMLTLGSRLVLVGGRLESPTRIHTAETQPADSAGDSLAKLQFTTETNQLKFTTEVMDLTRFVRKQGDTAHSLAGFSDVWKGEMTETGKPIAIKVLRLASTGNSDDPQSGRLRTRFDRELTIWMECQHPRVLELLGYAYIEGIPCLISPWCSNGNILEYLSKNPNADHSRLINQVAEGLVYLHGREPSVVHSDIKPANVVVSDEGNAKICDFGISKLMQENPSGLTTTASIKGTLRYSSPDMLDLDGKSTTASDVWAFGMLILHVMTKKLPYVTVLSDVKVILAIMNGEKPLPENYPELPAADPLWDVMRECWDDDPTKRPGMVAVFEKLQRCAQTQDDE